MLTRWEVEGGLRSLHPMRQNARQVRRAHSKTRRRARITLGALVGITLVGALGVARMHWEAPVATLQDTEWGNEHVGGYRSQPREPLFPPMKRSRWDSFAARAHGAGRDPVTGAPRHPKLARE